MEQFEEQLHQDLHQFLQSMKEVDERLPECPDVEDKWEEIAKAYIPDGIREFNDFPSASLGWMMYIGMAVAKFWDAEWEIYSKIEDLYAYMRDKRGYDAYVSCLHQLYLFGFAMQLNRMGYYMKKCDNK